MSAFTFIFGGVPGYEVKFYEPEFDIFKNSPDGEIGEHLEKIGQRIVTAAKRQVGKDTGDLMRSIHMIHSRVGLHQELWIGSENDIAYLHHEGARPHEIHARNHSYLRFTSKGRVVYTRKVNHPGTKPNRYLSDNLILVYT